MIALIIPERVPWEGAVRQRLGPHRVFRVPGAGRALARLPAAQRIPARLRLRRTAGALAAAWLPKRATAVMAPSLCGAEVFALAQRRGISTVLLEDLPDLAGLHADLDAAAARHPTQSFLHNVRASAWAVRRQAAERELADGLRVQGHHGALRLGGEPLIPSPPAGELRAFGTGLLSLAGPAMTRTGAFEALAVLDRFPAYRLSIRAIDATPAAVLAHPRVVQGEQLGDVVLAPAWVESWPSQVRAAAQRGVPIVGTRRALGWETGFEHDPGDVDGLERALVRALAAVDAHSTQPSRMASPTASVAL